MDAEVTLHGHTKIFTEEEAIRSTYPCPDCDGMSLKMDEDLMIKETERENAYRMNDLKPKLKDYIRMFKCHTCEATFDSLQLSNALSRMVHKKLDLRELAKQCNPHKGQTWSAGTGFPVETCSINGNPCYLELWRVCPHIGNDDVSDWLSNKDIPIIGE